MIVGVLGSDGQIGSYLCNYLKKRGYDVLEFDIVNGAHQDLTQFPNVDLHKLMLKADFIFFLAFDVGGSCYLQKYEHTFNFIDNNIRIMANVFGCLKKYKVPFVFASSQMSNMHHSSYGVLKRVGELYSQSLNGLVAKLWNVYGIEKNYDKSHVITDFIRKGFNSDVVQMISNGQEEREFLYVEDCCEALEILMINRKELSIKHELHITSFQSYAINEIAAIIIDCFKGIGKLVKFIPSEVGDIVQLDAKNKADPYIKKWWSANTNIIDGIKIIFDQMQQVEICGNEDSTLYYRDRALN